MATTYQTPGVYVEEVPSTIIPIAGVGTSTAGFIGVVADDVRMPLQPTAGTAEQRYQKAPSNQPVLVDSFEKFKTSFGNIQAGNRTLAVAVYGFFANGGQLCWVVGVPTKLKSADVEKQRWDFETETERLRVEGERLPALEASIAERDKDPAKLSADEQTTLAADKEDLKKNKPKYESDKKTYDGKTKPDYDKAFPAAAAGLVKLDAGAVKSALEALDVIEDISLIVVPGGEKAVQETVLDDCEREERTDRFAILDGVRKPKAVTKDNILEARNSDYGAIYFPWIKARWVEEQWPPGKEEPVVSTVTDFFPPSGHLAGLYARVDGTRGVHKAPANELIRGASDIELMVSKAQQAQLNTGGVNVIRKFGNNITVWGARTISNRADWNYVTSRRVFIYLRESIEAGTQWVVFEPNGPELWSKIRMNVRAFLTLAWQDGALFGNTPDEAFYVRCDETINTPAIRDLGRVVTEIGVALVKPAEFVIFRMSQMPGAGE